MSHFIVLVAGRDVESLLAPYSVDLEVPEYKAGPVAEEDMHSFMSHYLEKFPDEKKLSFEQLYSIHGKDWNDASWRSEDGTWSVFSTYNQKTKWDWHTVGGRWEGFIPRISGAPCDQCLKDEIDTEQMKVPFALVSSDGWHERGDMGYWGIVLNEKAQEKWRHEFLGLFSPIPGDTMITAVDCHI